MKKLALLTLAGAGALLAGRRLSAGKHEQALWAEATDAVTAAR